LTAYYAALKIAGIRERCEKMVAMASLLGLSAPLSYSFDDRRRSEASMKCAHIGICLIACSFGSAAIETVTAAGIALAQAQSPRTVSPPPPSPPATSAPAVTPTPSAAVASPTFTRDACKDVCNRAMESPLSAGERGYLRTCFMRDLCSDSVFQSAPIIK
jgi:hypothetical protein